MFRTFVEYVGSFQLPTYSYLFCQCWWDHTYKYARSSMKLRRSSWLARAAELSEAFLSQEHPGTMFQKSPGNFARSSSLMGGLRHGLGMKWNIVKWITQIKISTLPQWYSCQVFGSSFLFVGPLASQSPTVLDLVHLSPKNVGNTLARYCKCDASAMCTKFCSNSVQASLQGSDRGANFGDPTDLQGLWFKSVFCEALWLADMQEKLTRRQHNFAFARSWSVSSLVTAISSLILRKCCSTSENLQRRRVLIQTGRCASRQCRSLKFFFFFLVKSHWHIALFWCSDHQCSSRCASDRSQSTLWWAASWWHSLVLSTVTHWVLDTVDR